jgi:hypothetical protein
LKAEQAVIVAMKRAAATAFVRLCHFLMLLRASHSRKARLRAVHKYLKKSCIRRLGGSIKGVPDSIFGFGFMSHIVIQ